jgi:hypothetical protein
MNIIESYRFGRMVIDGTSYTKDVIPATPKMLSFILMVPF